MNSDDIVRRTRALLKRAAISQDIPSGRRQQLAEVVRTLAPSTAPSPSQRSRPGGATAGPMMAGGPAVVAVPVAVGVSLTGLLMLLVAITAAVLLYLLWDRFRDEINGLLVQMSRQLVIEVAQLRSRVREAQRTQGGGSCNQQFEALIAALNTLATKLTMLSGRHGIDVVRAVSTQLGEVVTALIAYIGCIDPDDSLGLVDEFLSPSGKITRELRRLIDALR